MILYIVLYQSFLTLKRLKPYLRNSTEENRLNGLARYFKYS